MSKRYKLSPTDNLNYVQKGKIPPSNRFNSFKKFLSSFFLILLLILILIPYYNRLNRRRIIDEEIRKEKENISRYEKNNEDLQALISYLNSEQAAEESARLNFGLQKEGETVVVVKVPSKTEVENLNNENKIESKNSAFQKWYNYFFKK